MNQLVKDRPAETGTVAGALAILIAYVLGIDDGTVLIALTVVLGAFPGVITWIVNEQRARKKPTHSNLIVPPE